MPLPLVTNNPPTPTNHHPPGRQVSTHDSENLSWVTLLPKDLRARVIALRAFYIELLLAGEAVRSKERALGAIR